MPQLNDLQRKEYNKQYYQKNKFVVNPSTGIKEKKIDARAKSEYCPVCKIYFSRGYFEKHILTKKHKNNSTP